MFENNKQATGTQPANSYRTSSAKTKTPRGNNRFLPNKDLSRERTIQPERNQERTANIHVTCQTRSKSSKRARNVKLMALNLHRNRRDGTERERRTKQTLKVNYTQTHRKYIHYHKKQRTNKKYSSQSKRRRKQTRYT